MVPMVSALERFHCTYSLLFYVVAFKTEYMIIMIIQALRELASARIEFKLSKFRNFIGEIINVPRSTIFGLRNYIFASCVDYLIRDTRLLFEFTRVFLKGSRLFNFEARLWIDSL